MRNGNHLLALLDFEAASALAPHLTSVPLRLGRHLCEPGEQVNAVYFPLSGIASVVTDMEDGRAMESLAVGRNGAVGLTCALGSGTSQARAIVQAAGVAFKVDATRLRDLASRYPSILGLALRYAQSEIAQLHQAAACNSLHRLEQRLARWLLTCDDLLKSDVVPMTQHSLSMMLGVQRTSVTAAAKELQRQGLIEYRRGCIKVVGRTGLERSSCECYEVTLGFMACVDWSADSSSAPTLRFEQQSSSKR